MTKQGSKQKPTSARSPTDVDVRTGGRIRILRQEQGLSQTDLGERCGITFQQVQKYERGSNRISGSRLVQIAKVLKTDVAYLLDGADRPLGKAQTAIERMLSEYQGHKLAAAFLSIEDAKVKADIALFVEAYAASLKRKR